MFCCKLLRDVITPNVTLNGMILKFVTDIKYLGIFLNNNECDNEDMKRQWSHFYKTGNSLIRKFRHCTENVKIDLYRTFISNMYGSQLWCSFTQSVYEKLRVSYNNVLRYFMCVALVIVFLVIL